MDPIATLAHLMGCIAAKDKDGASDAAQALNGWLSKGGFAPRLQVPVHSDAWMMGDRFGNLLKVTKAKAGATHPSNTGRMMAHVLMDRSGKVKRYWLDECSPI